VVKVFGGHALMAWPVWWEWEIEISSHCVKRMQERGFNEAELRAMIDDASGISEQAHGTYLLDTCYEGRKWEVIVSVDDARQTVIVVTAYPVS
jgi:hypothetical protein